MRASEGRSATRAHLRSPSSPRARTGIVLARVLRKDRTLLLLPGEGEHDFESLEVGDVAIVPDMIPGTQVLLIRR
jgi:hypothetical protein